MCCTVEMRAMNKTSGSFGGANGFAYFNVY